MVSGVLTFRPPCLLPKAEERLRKCFPPDRMDRAEPPGGRNHALLIRSLTGPNTAQAQDSRKAR